MAAGFKMSSTDAWTRKDILKASFKNEVNDIRSERLARSANPLALLAVAQPYSDNYYQAPVPQKLNGFTKDELHQMTFDRNRSSLVLHQMTSDHNRSELGIQDHSNERSSSKLVPKVVPLAVKTATSRQELELLFHHHIAMLRTTEFCKGFGHYARECKKPKRVKDYAYHKEKMMMCKQAEQGVPLQAEQADWLEDTDEEIDEQELEAHYSYMAKIQEVSPENSSFLTSPPYEHMYLEKDDSNVIPDSSNICTNDNQVDQNAAECVDERAALANLIAILTLDTEENKTTSRALGEATSSQDSCLIALQTKQTELEKYTTLNDRTSDYKILQTKLNETLGLLALKDIDIQEGVKTKTY
ncbi:hypothetical protein Tco_0893572 [Tanacetum coccineum]|uniref:CCHC-type domain-containing protein n=1 Tax=Tanacetum coccineum TaxID=301880 RepID=A0ABQ5C959_9ASTR